MRKNTHQHNAINNLIAGILSLQEIEQSDEISETKVSESETKEKTEEETKELKTRDTNVESLLASMTLEEGRHGQVIEIRLSSRS